MTDIPEPFKKRGVQEMQDSGVGSFGSESDSSPIQHSQHGQSRAPDSVLTQESPASPRTQHEHHSSVTLPTGSNVTSVNCNSTPVSTSIMSEPYIQQSGVDDPGHSGQLNNDCNAKPMIMVIPQSPPLTQTQSFIYDNNIPKKIDIDAKDNVSSIKDSIFHVTYYGESVLNRRYTRPMLPWIMAEIRRNSKQHEVTLEILPTTHVLQATERGTGKVLFQHKLPTVSSFARAHQDPTCFVYLTRNHVDCPFICHVFQVTEESKVPRLFSAIREATKEAVREAHHQVHTPDGAGEPSMVANSHLCEVMYVGKVVVTSKKAPPTFIDEAVEKFREHERHKTDCEDERRRHSSGNSVQSLPSDLEQIVTIRENEIGLQTPKDKGSNDSYVNLSEEDVADSIPLGGSSGTLLLNQALKSVHRQRRTSLQESDMHLVSNSQDSIKNTLTQQVGQGEGHRGEGHDYDNLQKYVLQSQSQVRKNRTMLLQVGQNDISLISTDKKKVIFERKFIDISFCSQGIQQPEHFGFISRDLVNNNMFMCYVFRCATEPLVEEVMQTLKQAFHTAYQQTTKTNVRCELCPMHQLHKLCEQIDKQPPDKVHEIVINRVEQLNEQDRNDIMEEYRLSSGQSIQEKNELMMSILRHMSEEKQHSHIHISDTNRAKNEFVLVDTGPESSCHGYHHSKFDLFKTKAKKSLTTSFENMLHRIPKKDDRRENFKQRSLTTESEGSYYSNHSVESSLVTSPEYTPVSSPMVREFHEQFPTPYIEPIPRAGRSRSYSTTALPTRDLSGVVNNKPHHHHGSTHQGSTLHGTHTDKVREDIIKLFGDSSPLKSMFHRVASSMNTNGSPHSPSPSRGQQMAISPFAKGSWRMDILSRVVTPSKPPRYKANRERHNSEDEELNLISEEQKNRKLRWRHLWRKAILETLLLIRMEKENKTLQARQDEVETRRIKLDYEEITPCLKEVTKVWDRMLNNPLRAIDKFELSQLYEAVKDGVPRAKRGDIWQLLVQQHRLHYPQLMLSHEDPMPESAYDDLLKQLTTHQHAILIDLGRTFPGHPYFANPLGQGQLALFNILKAYSLVDQEVGYCQGLSFVAGVLLMHMPEDTAFHVKKYMMFQLGFRRQYRPDMVALQIQLYQLSRLLHDCHRDLYEHLEKHEIAPTLYAAPWFLTVFASQFPLGFVARVFDLIFLQGIDVVFKVALVLLGNHKELIKQCNSFESIMEFLKTTLPSMGIIQMERVINQVFQMDLSKDLYGYEIEYHVLQEEMQKTPHRGDDDVISRLEQANHNLKRQNLELLEQLQASRSQAHSFEQQLHTVHGNQNKLKSHIRTLELERAALLNAVSKLRKLIPDEVIDGSNVNIPSLSADKMITNSPIHNPLVNRFLEDLDVTFTSSSLTDFDKEVSAFMAAKHRKLSDQGQNKSMKLPPQSSSNEFLTVDSAHAERPASTSY